MTPEQAAKLRAPFPPNMIGKLPKPHKKDAPRGNCKECGKYHGLPAVHLDYVGHAATTDRLLQVDSDWTWEPMSFDENGLPRLDASGGLWIRLTVAGVTRPGYGDQNMGKGMKEVIGDALRNAAMRFGVALDLWSKEDLQADHEGDETPRQEKPAPHGSNESPAPGQGHPETKDRPRSSSTDKFRIAMASWAKALGSSYATILGAHGYADVADVPEDTNIRGALLADFQGAYNEKKKLAAKMPATDEDVPY